jgi:hypothetical protein
MSIPKSSVSQAGLQRPSEAEQPVLRLPRTVSVSYSRIHNPGFRARRPHHDFLPITMKAPHLTAKASRHRIPIVLTFLLIVQAASSPNSTKSDIEQEVRYRKNREAWMRSPESPLALAGLFWLKAGINRFGTDQQNEVVLPAGTAAAWAGYFRVNGQHIGIVVESPSAAVYLDHQRITERELKTDADGRTRRMDRRAAHRPQEPPSGGILPS